MKNYHGFPFSGDGELLGQSLTHKVIHTQPVLNNLFHIHGMSAFLDLMQF